MLCLITAPLASRAQELEPRAYSPNPTGVNFLVLGYGRSTGDVLFDASAPVSDVHARLNSGVGGYGRTFALFDHSATATVVVPYVWGDVAGNVGENRREVSRSGLGDARLRLSINLIGGPALTPVEFSKRTPQTTLGVSLTVVPPVGQYDPAKLINLGSNRWALKPELGVSYPVGHWYLEGYAGAWFFTDNDDFLGGTHREQDPIATVQAHVSYSFRPRLWLAFDATYYSGGRTTVDGVHKADLQTNTRIGLTLSVPVGSRQSVKLNWSDGATTRAGGDFAAVGVVWQYTWFD